MNSTDPNINGILSSVRILLITIGGVMAGDGLQNTTAYHWVMIIAGSIMVVGPAAWGVYSSFVNFRRARAVGVHAQVRAEIAHRSPSEGRVPRRGGTGQ